MLLVDVVAIKYNTRYILFERKQVNKYGGFGGTMCMLDIQF